ncbi:ankyrin repeat-containing domain protein [Hyaloscypha sp. PMI_1271]|nr:ankyrin repeat-containing domain protein [Hyaloscypha sp. PMI_1271]
MKSDYYHTEGLLPLSEREELYPGSRSLPKVVGVVRSLLDAGVDANGESNNCFLSYEHGHKEDGCRHSTAYTALDLSVLTGSVELVDMLLRAGASTTTKFSFGHAIQLGSLELIDRLLSVGAPVSIRAVNSAIRKDGNGQYIKALLSKRRSIRIKGIVLVEAIELGATSTIEDLFKDKTSNLRKLIHNSSHLTTAIESCCASGHLDTLHLLLDKSSTSNFSLSQWFGQSIRMAVSNHHDKVVDALLSANADVNATNDVGKTALLAATQNQNKRIIGNLTSYTSAGALLNTESKCCFVCMSNNKHHKVFGDVLIAAIQWGDYSVVKGLVEAGANIDALGKVSGGSRMGWYGCPCMTALTAAMMAKDSILVDYLMGEGAAVNNPPNWPRAKSALCVAIDQNNLQKVQLLLEAGAQVNKDLAGDMQFSPMQLASENRDTEMVRLLLQYKGDPNAVFGEMKHTPLQMASRDGSKEMVELLLEQGADVNSPSAKKFGATALQFAAIKGLLGIAYLLLENGADVNAPPAEMGGRTALEGAAEHGRVDMVQLLLNAGANISQDQGGQSLYENAARRATENSHRAIRRLLESYHG